MRTEIASWLKKRLTRGQYFGLELTVGAALFIVAAWMFGGIAEGVVTHESITSVDEQIARWFHAHELPSVTAVMRAVSALHTWPIGMLAGGFLLYVWIRREQLWAIFALCAVVGGIGLNTVLKLAFHRQRPTLSGLSSAMHTYSFPSGHTLAATLIYGVVVAYAVRKANSHAARIAIVAAAIAIVTLVALSRIYLGVHYLSDVLAAVTEGVGWLALCYTAAETFMARRARKAES